MRSVTDAIDEHACGVPFKILFLLVCRRVPEFQSSSHHALCLQSELRRHRQMRAFVILSCGSVQLLQPQSAVHVALSYSEMKWTQTVSAAGESLCVEADAERLCHNRRTDRSVRDNMKLCKTSQEARDRGGTGCKSCLRPLVLAQPNFLTSPTVAMIV